MTLFHLEFKERKQFSPLMLSSNNAGSVCDMFYMYVCMCVHVRLCTCTTAAHFLESPRLCVLQIRRPGIHLLDTTVFIKVSFSITCLTLRFCPIMEIHRRKCIVPSSRGANVIGFFFCTLCPRGSKALLF